MEELTPLLEQLATQMNTTVEFLWGVMVKQSQVYVISYITWWIIFAILFYPAIWTSKWFMRIIQSNVAGEDDEKIIAAFFFTLLLWIFVGFTGLGNLLAMEEFLSALLNPEYWALQQILEVIK